MPRLTKVQSVKMRVLQKYPKIDNSVNQQCISTSQLTASQIERIRKDLITKVNYLSEKELIASSQLFNNIVYKTGIYKGKILSSYLQKKAVELMYTIKGKSSFNFQETIKSLKIENSKLKKKIQRLNYKVASLTQKLQYFKRSKNKHISKIRSVVRKRQKISDKNVNKAIIKKFKQNDRTYTPEFVSLATNLSTTGQVSIASTVQYTKKIVAFLTGYSPQLWLSASTLSRWTKEVAQISIQDNLPQFSSRFSSYEPMLTILNMKDLDQCSALTVSSSVGEAIIKNSLNPAQSIEHPDEVFVEEFLLAYEILPEDEFVDLTNRVENGLVKALEAFKK
ncbi:8062_t:CDS:2 [Dentiscutata erythropus]|uniref:8062_t:CDS:1 n=1 Tax=Dentiscutata erythropus TaxID=1348616 RepID=A0A9N9AXW8_9GLOM|nr:8062_t:CDS:2 [Dentiscutata erythropus]